MIEGHTILCDSNIPWERNRYSKHHLMSRLARKNRVVFVDPPRPLGAQLRDSGPAALAGRVWRPDGEDLTVLSPSRLPWTDRYDFVVNTADPWYFVTQINRALGRYDPRKLVLFLGNPWHTNLLEAYPGAACTIYHCSDDFPSLFDGPFRQRLAERERTLARAADLVLAVSPPLRGRWRRENHRTHLFPNAVDELFFRPQREPGELAGLPRPIVGFAGSIDERLDLDLVRATAERLGRMTFVFIGPIAPAVQRRWAAVAGRPNVRYLGSKPWDRLPGYLQAFDCCIMPLVRDEFNLARCPLKLYEYLASGKRVVTTLPVEPRLSSAVTAATTARAFAQGVANAAMRRSVAAPAKARKLVAHDTWDERAGLLSRLIDQAIASKR
ncbi:MAG: glycosyltransferase [Candidatus Edwardsbacteria bacterium]|jgi:glycosyltransferase involved in cell wall biosynthesis|nr:glycosyltransferase [Candidatus Edwardsbacteria bacterium]